MADVACDIVTQIDGTRWILAVTGGYYGYVIYYDLTNNNGWHHKSTLYNNYKQERMSVISLSPSHTFLMGGYSQRHSTSTKNFWRYHFDKNNFYDTMHYIRNEHRWGGFFTKAKTTMRALTNCHAERTYAVVGWGGHTSSGSDYSPYWDILLRKRRVTGDPQKPVRCDSAIPYLSPGRYMTGDNLVKALPLQESNFLAMLKYRCNRVLKKNIYPRSDGHRVQADGVRGLPIRTIFFHLCKSLSSVLLSPWFPGLRLFLAGHQLHLSNMANHGQHAHLVLKTSN